jgi:hypothetical protein
LVARIGLRPGTVCKQHRSDWQHYCQQAAPGCESVLAALVVCALSAGVECLHASIQADALSGPTALAGPGRLLPRHRALCFRPDVDQCLAPPEDRGQRQPNEYTKNF